MGDLGGPAPETRSRADLIALGDRMLRTADALVAAVAVGYRSVERELIVRNAEARRAFLDELLGVVAVDTATIGRLRRLSARNGLDPCATYRLVVIAARAQEDDAEAELLAMRIRTRLAGPAVVDRARAGVALPQVVAWRGRVVVLAKASWAGIGRLRDGLADVAGAESTAVLSPPTAGVERLAPAMARLFETLRTALRLGRRGWIEDPDDLAVERLLLADDALLATVVERELGPLLADPRMGEELVEHAPGLLRHRREHARDGPPAPPREPDRRLPPRTHPGAPGPPARRPEPAAAGRRAARPPDPARAALRAGSGGQPIRPSSASNGSNDSVRSATASAADRPDGPSSCGSPETARQPRSASMSSVARATPIAPRA